MTEAYLLIDLSSGAVRAYVVTPDGQKRAQKSRAIHNVRDPKFADALSFDPNLLQQNLISVCAEAVAAAGEVCIVAVSATSAREGIVLLDADNHPLGGYPNIDNRGQAWEQEIEDHHGIYARSGHWVSTLFPAVKLLGLRTVYPEIWEKATHFLSLSDWVGWLFTGQAGYEQSQACETLLFDVQSAQWSDDLCSRFQIPRSMLPPVLKCGSLLGETQADISHAIGIPSGIPFIVGGADTQLAVAHCQPAVGDIVIVAGTTTPIAYLSPQYLVDPEERCWVDRHVSDNHYIIETNVGVSGMNYDRAIRMFYPGCSYNQVEAELRTRQPGRCLCTIGSMIFHKAKLTPVGGFFMEAPLSDQIERADLVLSVLLDYAFSFKTNLDQLLDVVHKENAVLYGCGGGFIGTILPQLLANISGCEIRVPQNFELASCSGLVDQINHYFQRTGNSAQLHHIITPHPAEVLLPYYEQWQAYRHLLHG